MWPTTLVNPVIFTFHFTSIPYYFIQCIALGSKINFPSSFCLRCFILDSLSGVLEAKFYLLWLFLVSYSKCAYMHHFKYIQMNQKTLHILYIYCMCGSQGNCELQMWICENSSTAEIDHNVRGEKSGLAGYQLNLEQKLKRKEGGDTRWDLMVQPMKI